MPQALQLCGDGACGGASTAADDLAAVGLADNFWGAITGGGVGMDGVRVLFDYLAGFGIDEAAVAVLDWDGDGVAASGALAFLGGHGFGGFEPGGAVATVEGEALSTGAGGAEGGGGAGDADIEARRGGEDGGGCDGGHRHGGGDGERCFALGATHEHAGL